MALSITSFVVDLLLYQAAAGHSRADPAGLLAAAAQVLPYGIVGAVLLAKRPDLPFGWLLSLAAMSMVLMVAVTGMSIWALEQGWGGGLAVWGLTFGSLAFVPLALQGVVNVRFPSGRPAGRWGRLLDRVLRWGIAVALLGGLMGDLTIRSIYPGGVPGGAERIIDGTPVVAVGNALVVVVPVVILLGVLAGLGVVVRCLRAEGVERLQLQWRAAGVVIALVLFPFAVAETLPEWVSNVDPLVFVVTLVIPVLRYDLWAIDTLIRRSAASTLASSGSVTQNMLRVGAEMLRLPYVAVRRDQTVLAAYGEATPGVEAWPLTDRGAAIGTLVAAPRRGLPTLDEQDRRVLATLAQLIAGSVRAEVLNADLMDARHRLVTGREEERRRLRRDLHDGIGPLLTGLSLNLDAAQSNLTRDPERAATYVGYAKDASTQVIVSLREVVNGLRPPALDDLGLVGALRLQADRVARDSGLLVELVAPDQLALPAAVEVAAYRTVVEGVTNAVRHSASRRVRIVMDRSDAQLTITISDDGGPTAPWHPGVGLAAMRERAEELGGVFQAGPAPGGGVVTASYPLDGGGP